MLSAEEGDALVAVLGTEALDDGAMRRLAEAGNTAHELMAISGHKTLSEVQRYTAAADKKWLAESGMEKMRRETKRDDTYTNIASPLHKQTKKANDNNV